jgi:hypothetical protein
LETPDVARARGGRSHIMVFRYFNGLRAEMMKNDEK